MGIGGFLAENSIQIAMFLNPTILKEILQLHFNNNTFQFAMKTSD